MTVSEKKRVTVLVRGRVQGVGFRAFAQRQALDLGLAGYAENLSDGRVEIVAEGPASELRHFLVKLRQGPSHARVEDFEEAWAEGSGLAGFYCY